jgi:hypothetical protein
MFLLTPAGGRPNGPIGTCSATDIILLARYIVSATGLPVGTEVRSGYKGWLAHSAAYVSCAKP